MRFVPESDSYKVSWLYYYGRCFFAYGPVPAGVAFRQSRRVNMAMPVAARLNRRPGVKVWSSPVSRNMPQERQMENPTPSAAACVRDRRIRFLPHVACQRAERRQEKARQSRAKWKPVPRRRSTNIPASGVSLALMLKCGEKLNEASSSSISSSSPHWRATM